MFWSGSYLVVFPGPPIIENNYKLSATNLYRAFQLFLKKEGLCPVSETGSLFWAFSEAQLPVFGILGNWVAAS
ncbi:MAG: hypothetical protein QOI57_2787 [Rubrobacteraceae bacterium]|jgi:hypothetical protein|nr:hypothetical protein [Rubrobacteraceae bacterium]